MSTGEISLEQYEHLDALFEELLSAPQRRETASHEFIDHLRSVCGPCGTDDGELVDGLARHMSLPEDAAPVEFAIAFATGLATVEELSCGVLDKLLPAAVALADQNATEPDVIAWLCLLCHFLATSEVNIAEIYEYQVVDKAVASLQQSPNDAKLLMGASVCLSHFACYELNGALRALHEGMVNFIDDPKLCAVVLGTLSSLAVHRQQDIGKAIQLHIGAFQAQQILDTATRHLENSNVCRNAALCLERIMDGCSTNAEALSGRGALAVILEVLRHHTTEAEVVLPCLVSLASIGLDKHHDGLAETLSTVLRNHASNETLLVHCIRLLTTAGKNEGYREAIVTEAVPTVLDVMARRASNTGLQQDACNLLYILGNVGEATPQAIGLAIAAMTASKDDCAVQVWGLAALSSLGSTERGQEAIAQAKGVAATCAAMKRFPTNAKIQELGCAVLAVMSWSYEPKEEVVACRGLERVVEAMRSMPDDTGVQKNACHALSQLAYNNEPNRDEIGRQGGIGLVCQAMARHHASERTQVYGCMALANLAWLSETNANDICRNQGYSLVIDAMRRYQSDAELQETACRALANIPFGKVPLETTCNAILCILQAMAGFERTREVQEEACRAIVTLAQGNERKSKNELSRQGAVDRVVAAMRNFPDEAMVLQEGCSALAHLSYDHGELTRQITARGGVALCLSAMQKAPSNMRVQMAACNALSGLAFNNAEGQAHILQQRGVSHVIDAMHTCDRVKMQEIGCLVLGTLSWNDEIKEAVAAGGGMECIVKAMVKYPEHGGLQKNGCRAISQLAYNSESNRDHLHQIGGVKAVVVAMKMHTRNDKLLLHACVALTYLSWRSEPIVQEIQELSGVAVIQQVIDTFRDNEKLRKKAEHLRIILNRRGSPQSESPSACGHSPHDSGSSEEKSCPGHLSFPYSPMTQANSPLSLDNSFPSSKDRSFNSPTTPINVPLRGTPTQPQAWGRFPDGKELGRDDKISASQRLRDNDSFDDARFRREPRHIEVKTTRHNGDGNGWRRGEMGGRSHGGGRANGGRRGRGRGN